MLHDPLNCLWFKLISSDGSNILVLFSFAICLSISLMKLRNKISLIGL